MSGPIRSLIIKEWHEQKWRCASLCAIGLSVVVFAMFYESDLVIVSAIMTIYVQAFIGTMFIAMGVAAGERSQGTLELLRALPIRMPKVAAVKLGFGALMCVVPILATLLVIGSWLGVIYLLALSGHEASIALMDQVRGADVGSDQLIQVILVGILMGINVYLWLVALVAGQRSELRAGIVGLGIVITWVLVLLGTFWVLLRVFFYDVTDGYNEWIFLKYLYALLMGVSPYGMYVLYLQGDLPVWPVVVAQMCTDCVLITWALLRYGRMTQTDNSSPAGGKGSLTSFRLTRPRYAPITAIAWKQWRDSFPIVTTALLVVLLLVSFNLIQYASAINLSGEPTDSMDRIANWILEASVIVGLFLALVVGLGAFVGDYRPETLTFWRSRPINPRLWFWSKYLTGLVIVELTAILPWVIAVAIAGKAYKLPGDEYLGTMPFIYMMIYTVAVWMAVLLRHTIYAGLMATGFVVAVMVPPQMGNKLGWISYERALYHVRASEGMDRWLGAESLPFFLLMVLLTVITLWLATRAARRDSAFVFER